MFLLKKVLLILSPVLLIICAILISIYKYNYFPLRFGIYIDKLPYKNFTSRDYREIGEKLFLQKHDFKNAIIHLQKAVELKSDNENALFMLGRIAFVQNNLFNAIKYFNQVLELNPLSTESLYGLGLTYGYLNDYREAEQSFLRFFEVIEILKKIDKNCTEHNGLWAAYNDLAWIYFLEGKYTEAENVTDKALVKYRNPWLYMMKGAILLNKGQKAEAKKYFEQADMQADYLTPEKFGEAYTGDNKAMHTKGLENMRQIIKDNLEKSQ